MVGQNASPFACAAGIVSPVVAVYLPARFAVGLQSLPEAIIVRHCWCSRWSSYRPAGRPRPADKTPPWFFRGDEGSKAVDSLDVRRNRHWLRGRLEFAGPVLCPHSIEKLSPCTGARPSGRCAAKFSCLRRSSCRPAKDCHLAATAARHCRRSSHRVDAPPLLRGRGRPADWSCRRR